MIEEKSEAPSSAAVSRMDFVVVSFNREISQLLLQARSLARSNARHFVARYIVLWNEETAAEEMDEVLSDRLRAELGPAGILVDILPRAAFMERALGSASPGARSQQAMKLLAARHVETPRYCILDSKNHVIRDLAPGDFISEDGRIRSHRQSYSPGTPWGDRFAASLRYFGLNEAGAPYAIRMPTTTPYVMETSRVCDLLSTVERQEGCDFATAFLTRPALSDTTEFLLWYAWLLACDPELPARLYQLKERIYVSFFNNSPQGDAAIAFEIARTASLEVKMLGLHRGRFHRLTPAEREAFIARWLEAGLFRTKAECEAFIAKGTISPLAG